MESKYENGVDEVTLDTSQGMTQPQMAQYVLETDPNRELPTFSSRRHRMPVDTLPFENASLYNARDAVKRDATRVSRSSSSAHTDASSSTESVSALASSSTSQSKSSQDKLTKRPKNKSQVKKDAAREPQLPEKWSKAEMPFEPHPDGGPYLSMRSTIAQTLGPKILASFGTSSE